MKKFEFHEAEFLEALNGALRIDSTNGHCGPVTEKAPLGEGIYEVLDYVCTLGRKMGFRAKLLDGKAAWIEAGDGEKLVGVLAHVDTVPVNAAEWEFPPHALTVNDGFLYGRGAADNKGPAILSLFALRAVSESGSLGGKRVRIIIGGDEEVPTWRCMERYKQTEEIPAMSFTPDGRYPVTYAEKSILQMIISGSPGNTSLDITAGTAWNVVPDYAEAVYRGERYEAVGKPAHAAMPHLGDNAILKLGETLARAGCGDPFVKLLAIANLDGLDIRLSDEISGETTMNPAVALRSGEEAELRCDLRLPISAEPGEVLSRVNARISPLGFTARQHSYTPALYVPKDSELVVKLMGVYKEITGSDEEAVSSGGSTYAKAFPNAVAFGAAFAGEKSNIHESNERWSFENVRKNFQIIANAMMVL